MFHVEVRPDYMSMSDKNDIHTASIWTCFCWKDKQDPYKNPHQFKIDSREDLSKAANFLKGKTEPCAITFTHVIDIELVMTKFYKELEIQQNPS